MGIIHHDQPFDDTYSQEIIGRIMNLSPELNEYVVTKQYLVETQEENLSPLWLRNKLLGKLNDELVASGINVNMDIDDVMDRPLLVEALLVLKAKFDEEKLFEFLKDHQDTREELSMLVDDDCITAIIECCSKNFPFDEGWDALVDISAENPGIISSGDQFNDLLATVFERCARLGDNPDVTDSETDKSLKYLNYLRDRKNEIVKIASVIYSANDDGQINADREKIISEAVTRFESQLSRPSAIRDFLDGELNPKAYLDTLRHRYVNGWKHCLEYWTTTADAKAVPSDLDMAVLVATLYVDAPDKEHARIHVVETFENLIDQFGDRYQTFRDIIDKALGNLVVVEGRLNNEIA